MRATRWNPVLSAPYKLDKTIPSRREKLERVEEKESSVYIRFGLRGYAERLAQEEEHGS